jgi:TolB protein
MRKSIVVVIVALLGAVMAVAAVAEPRGTNGQIAFSRFNPALGDTQVWVVNPDGSNEHIVQSSSDTGECPHWSPDGTRIATCGDSAGVTRLINPDDGSFHVVPSPDPSLFLPCGWWIASRLVCETFSDDGSANGLTSIRASDGGGLSRITSNPSGDDLPGDASPDGKKFVFVRYDANGNNLGTLVVDTRNGKLTQVLPGGLNLSSSGSWAPNGNDIVFSQRLADSRSSIWVVHANGSGLHQVNIAPAGACGGLIADPASRGCFSPAWSPDGTKIVFARGTSGDFDAQLYTVNADGSALTQLTHLGVSAESPDWGTHPAR